MSHGIMFHHFHSSVHPRRPGSISSSELERLLVNLGSHHNILQPSDFLERLAGKKLGPEDVVLTFDDSLKSQFDVAMPVLEAFDYEAIFFVYSAASGELPPPPLELFAAFRASEFEGFEDFYEEFLQVCSKSIPDILRRLRTDFRHDYLNNYAFYSLKEKHFRFIRDELLGEENYSKLMFQQMAQHERFDPTSVGENLFMSEENLRSLLEKNHQLGLHSHSHPTSMATLAEEIQRDEYQKNYEYLNEKFSISPSWVAHPCGSYSKVTLEILFELGVQAGFRDSMTAGPFNTKLEIPREDHANLSSLYQRI